MTDIFGYGEIGLDINPRHPCEGCRDYEAPDGCKSNGGCGKPQTNADRIRSMTDEELANFIGFACQDAFAYGAGLRNKMLIYPFGTREETFGWLKAPVDGGEQG